MEKLKQIETEPENVTFMSETIYELNVTNDKLLSIARRLDKLSFKAGTNNMEVEIDGCETLKAENHIQRIGNLLLGFNDKIENINKRIAELEQFI